MIFFLLNTLLAAAQECPRSKIKKIANINSDQITEASGIVVTETLIWVHNDSGDSATLYAISPNGQPLGSAPIKGAFARDWEDMTSFQKDGERFFLIGDIGDNKERKTFTEFYVIQEPSHLGEVNLSYSFTVEYDIGPKDAEAMFVDPQTNDLIVLTKGREGTAYWLRAPLPEEKSHIKMTVFHQEKVSELPPVTKRDGAILKTAADISPDGSWIITRNYLSSTLWYHPAGQDMALTLQQGTCPIPLPLQPQGETIAFAPDGKSLWTISEGKETILYKIELFE